MTKPSNESAYPDAVIRAVEPEDFRALKAVYEQPRAYFSTLQMPYQTCDMWRQRLANPRDGFWSLAACIDDLPIGHIALSIPGNSRMRHSGHIGMAVHDDYAGRGIGEWLMRSVLDIADNWLNLMRVELTVYADNQRAQRLYERNGFEAEGRLRRYAFRDGEFVDAIAMARLRQPAGAG